MANRCASCNVKGLTFSTAVVYCRNIAFLLCCSRQTARVENVHHSLRCILPFRDVDTWDVLLWFGLLRTDTIKLISLDLR
jgi:hypothetical protein